MTNHPCLCTHAKTSHVELRVELKSDIPHWYGCVECWKAGKRCKFYVPSAKVVNTDVALSH